MKHEPKLTFATLTALVLDTVQYLDCNKTFRNEDDVIYAVKHLSDQFPVMKLEEWKVIMDRLKQGHYGKLYERLKLPELVDVFKQYEGERAKMMERQITQDKSEYEQRFPDWKVEVIKRIADDLKLPEDDTDAKGRWKFIEHPNSTDAEQTSKTSE
jgi:hypothetical protein